MIPPEEEEPQQTSGSALKQQFLMKYQYYLDYSTIFPYTRWITFFILILSYSLRVYFLDGFYIVSYALAIYILSIFLGFISPKEDYEGKPLPQTTDDEYRPFNRKVHEFVFWYSITKATLIAFGCTFFSFFNLPAFWPILVIYFFILSFATLKDRVMHMWTYGYVPWSKKKTIYPGEESVKQTNEQRHHKD